VFSCPDDSTVDEPVEVGMFAERVNSVEDIVIGWLEDCTALAWLDNSGELELLLGAKA
jgi:hypothetical protein